MKYILFILPLIFNSQSFANFNSEKIKMMTGKEFSIGSMNQKATLVVNIATQCGYTPQLEGLEALHKKYKDKGLLVVGIPSNDFGGQTPQANKEVKKFCKLRYGVSFPLTTKTKVIGRDKHSLVKELISLSGDKAEIKWNFEKFLVNKKGKLVGRYKSSVKPNDKVLIESIEKTLR